MQKILLLIVLLIPIYVIGQTGQDCPEADELKDKITQREREINTLEAELIWNKQTFPEKLIEKKLSRNYNQLTQTFSMQIENVSQEEFIELCNSGRPDMEKLREKYPDVNIYAMYSYNWRNNTVNAYVEEIGQPRPTLLTAAELEGIAAQNAAKQKQLKLEKIQHRRKMYIDLIDALDNEIKFNKVEVVDNASELLMKNIPIDNKAVENIIGVSKEQAMAALREKENVSPSNIENPVADAVVKTIDITEKAIEFIPGGSKITNHYLWKLFKSTPEAGKGLGHAAAGINIYFRQKEYKKLVEDLNKEEQRILNDWLF